MRFRQRGTYLGAAFFKTEPIDAKISSGFPFGHQTIPTVTLLASIDIRKTQVNACGPYLWSTIIHVQQGQIPRFHMYICQHLTMTP